MNHLKKIVKWVINILTVLLVVILLLVIYGKLSLTFSNNKYPNYFGYTLFEVASGSMLPTLEINDVVLVKISKDNIKEDDIIAFQKEDSIITHRVVFIDNDTLTVKGDSNNVVDDPIKVNQVIGKVIKVFPKLGVWKKVINDPKILIALFVTLLLFDFALSYKEPKKDNKKKEIKEEKQEEKKEEIIIKKIEAPKDDHDITEREKLLEITRQISIEDINKLIEGTDLELNKKEIENVKVEIKKIDNDKKEIHESNLSDKEKDFLDYTMRLDLNEIQNRIDKKIR